MQVRPRENIRGYPANYTGRLDGFYEWYTGNGMGQMIPDSLETALDVTRSCKELVAKYNLACRYDERFGGELAHIVVMQYVNKEIIDKFIKDLSSSL